LAKDKLNEILRYSEKVTEEATKEVEKTEKILRDIKQESSIDVLRRLGVFEMHWNEMCEKFETAEMSLNDAKYCRLTFSDRREKFRASVLLEISSTHYSLKNEIDSRLDKVEGAILKAKANFREKEKVRLKDVYGSFGIIIYIFWKIIKKI
jgi:hypothetical protein